MKMETTSYESQLPVRIRRAIMQTDTAFQRREMSPVTASEREARRSMPELGTIDKVHRGIVTSMSYECAVPRALLQWLMYETKVMGESSQKRDMGNAPISIRYGAESIPLTGQGGLVEMLRNTPYATDEMQLRAALQSLMVVDKDDMHDRPFLYCFSRPTPFTYDHDELVVPAEVRKVLHHPDALIGARYAVSTEGLRSPALVWGHLQVIGKRVRDDYDPPERFISIIEQAYKASKIDETLLIGLNRTCEAYQPSGNLVVVGAAKQKACIIPLEKMASVLNCDAEQLLAALRAGTDNGEQLIPCSRNLVSRVYDTYQK